MILNVLLGLLLAAAAHTNPQQLTYTPANGTTALKVGDKLAERCTFGDYPAGAVATQMASANTNCRRIYFPAGTYSFSTTITMPATFGRQWVGDGSQATSLVYTGTGPCGILVGGSKAGGFEGMSISVTNTSGASAPVCFDDTTGAVQRWHFVDVQLNGAQSPPITGAYCLSMHSSTGAGIAYNWGTGVTTLNCDRGIEMLGDSGSGGVNANWFFGYSSNGNVSGVYFDNFAGDNYVQGHCNASGTTFAQTCAVTSDGVHTTSGNEVHLVADNGTNGSVFNCAAHTVNSFIFAVKEGSGTDTVACDSTNFIFSTTAVGAANKNFFAASMSVGGSVVATGASIFSSSLIAGRLQTSTTPGGGTVTLTSGTPSTATAGVFTGARCVCTNTTTQSNPVKCSVTSALLTVTGPNTVADTIAYFCF